MRTLATLSFHKAHPLLGRLKLIKSVWARPERPKNNLCVGSNRTNTTNLFGTHSDYNNAKVNKSNQLHIIQFFKQSQLLFFAQTALVWSSNSGLGHELRQRNLRSMTDRSHSCSTILRGWKAGLH